MNGSSLASLMERLRKENIGAALHGDASTVVVDVAFDSREITPNSLFCCVKGEAQDGHAHAAAAREAGAVALVVQHPLGLDVPEIVVDDVRSAMGHLAAKVHGDPSRDLRCVGVTGTNGKTTTVSLLQAIGSAAGLQTSVIGTLTGKRTTPEAPDLQRTLAALRSQGCELVAMEVSSHGLVQGRANGTKFAVGVFTNLTEDHLDYHRTMEEYFRAKARLFEPGLSDAGVVNLDDRHGALLADAAVIPTIGFHAADAEPVASIAPLSFAWHGQVVTTHLAGRFNLENALAAAHAAQLLGISDDAIISGLAQASAPPGRFDIVEAGQPFTVVIDFAHTPDGLAKILDTARDIAGQNRVLVTFGAGGDRDASKRPLMGAAAAKRADHVIVTSDNARSEDPATIAESIASGMHNVSMSLELDRHRAIEDVINMASRGDVVVIAGKGHEATQQIGDHTVPFNDRLVALEVLGAMGFGS